MIEKTLDSLVLEVKEMSPKLGSRAEFDSFKSTISGPKGKLTDVMKLMGKVPKEEKPAMGKKINEAKQVIQASMDEANKRIEESELLSSLGPTIDPTLPSPDSEKGVLHTIAQDRPHELNSGYSLNRFSTGHLIDEKGLGTKTWIS